MQLRNLEGSPIKALGKPALMGTSLYAKLEKYASVCEVVQRLLEQKKCILDKDGKLHLNIGFVCLSPWIHQHEKERVERRCPLWKDIYFDCFGLVHSGCMSCWKICIYPTTIVELFELLDIQKAWKRPSKCGAEMRDYTCGIYSGYFYCDSKKEGQKLHGQLRKVIDKKMGTHVQMILKRSCTEIEMTMGPSSFWIDDSGKAMEMEALLDSLFVYDLPHFEQTPHWIEKGIKVGWINWAHQHGDMTYLKYTGGMPIFTPPDTYHNQGVEDEAKLLRTRKV